MAWNLEIANIELEQGTALGLKVGNPANPEKPMIMALIGKRGLLVCRNFDIAAMEARGIAAGRVQGITSFEEALSTTIESCTAQAKAVGVINEMTGKQALAKFL